MENQNKYKEPELEVIRLSKESVIRTSPTSGDGTETKEDEGTALMSMRHVFIK